VRRRVRLGSVVLKVRDVRQAMEFWGEALDYEPREEPEPDWVVLTPRDGEGPNISLELTEEPPAAFPHMHFDLYTRDPVGEVARLTGLGARTVEDWPYPEGDRDFVVLEDPDGNRFCVIDKRPG